MPEQPPCGWQYPAGWFYAKITAIIFYGLKHPMIMHIYDVKCKIKKNVINMLSEKQILLNISN